MIHPLPPGKRPGPMPQSDVRMKKANWVTVACSLSLTSRPLWLWLPLRGAKVYPTFF